MTLVRSANRPKVLGSDVPAETSASFACDICSRSIEGAPAGRGLLLFPEGNTVRREEPPLCADCAQNIGIAGSARFLVEDEEG